MPVRRSVRDIIPMRLMGGIAAAVLVVLLATSGYLESLEHWALDRLFEVRGPRPPVAPIVIVSVDEASFQELNLPWPFPRALHAKLIDRISAGKPLAIALDIILDAPSARGDADDVALGAAVARAGNVVLAAAHFAEFTDGLLREGSNFPLPVIREGAAAVAPVNLMHDRDGHVRRGPQRVRLGAEWFDALDVVLARMLSARGVRVAPVPGAPDVLINFRGAPGTFASTSYYRVLDGEVSPEVFRDKVVYVGPTSVVLHDVFATAFARAGDMPGVEVHANLLDSYVRGDVLREIPSWLTTLVAAVAAVLGGYLVVRLQALRAAAVVVLAWALLATATVVAFAWADVWLRAMAATIGLGLGFGATVVEHFIREQREKRRLSQFFSPDVLRAVVRGRGEISLASSRRTLTVLFSDIRGFTSMAERLEPEEVAAMLGEYLTEMTEIVFRHGGTVDKYIGDCVMALYNVPFEDPDHAVRAVQTALEFQERTLAVSQRWEERIGVSIRNGVGINTGEAVVGTLGSRQRLEYTAIGDTVNLAARLESLTKEYGAGIIVSESTYAAVKGQFLTRELGAVTVKGKTRPVKIYAVVPADLRQYPRIAVETAGRLVAIEGDRACEVRVRDISDGGMAITDVPEEWLTGAKVEIRCEGGGLAAPLVAHGIIVWRHDDAAGVAYTEAPLTPEPGPATPVRLALDAGDAARHRQPTE
jgi:adenylate cyclase